MNRNDVELSLRASEFEEDYRSLEQRSLEIWLVLQLLDGDFSGNCSWHELEAIPQAKFSLLRNLPSIVNLVREALNAPSRYLNQRGTLFSIEQKLFVNCSVSGQVSPLKSKVLAEASNDGEERQDFSLSYSTIVELFKDKLFQQVVVLQANAENQADAIADFCAGLSEGNSLSARMQGLRAKYARLIAFSKDPSGVDAPFSNEKVFENILSLYADREALLLELKQDHEGVYSCAFLNTCFSQANYIFHPYFNRLSDEHYTQWKNSEIEFNLIDLRYRLRFSHDDTVASLQLNFEDDNIDDLRGRFYSVFEELNAIFENSKRGDEGLSQLIPIIAGLEQVYCADVILSELAGLDLEAKNENSGAEPKSKMRKKTAFHRTQGDKHTVKYLCDFANALYVFIARVHLPLCDNHSRDPADFMVWHDSEYIKARHSMTWVRRWITGLSAYDAVVSSRPAEEQAAHQRFLRLAQRFSQACSARVQVLATSRLQLHSILLKELHSFSDSSNIELNKALVQLRQMLTPSWDEWDSKEANISCYVDIINKNQYFSRIIDQFLRSVALTNEQAHFNVGYSGVSGRVIQSRQADLISLATMRNVVATEFYNGIFQWFEKIKSTVDAQAHSLQDVIDKFYLLALYPYHRRTVLHNLTRLTQAGQWDESVALGEAISQFEPDRCAKAILKLQSSLPITELVARFSARYRSFEKIRTKLPSVFNLLVRYLIVKDSSGVDALYQDSLDANTVIGEFSAENRPILDELMLLKDFTAGLPQDAPLITQIQVFNKFNQTVAEYQNTVANLVYLSGQSCKSTEANCNEPERKLATMVQATWTVMSSANDLLKKVIRGIESANNNEILEQAEGWRAMLEEESDACARKISELKSLLRLDGRGIDDLSRCKPELRDVAYVALPLAIRHFDSVVEKMQGLRVRLLPPDCDGGPSKRPFSNQ